MLRGELIDLAQTWNDQVFRDAPGEHRKWIDEYRDAQEKGFELDNIRGAKQQSISPGADMLSVRDCNFGCVFTYVEAGCIFQLVECRMLTKSFLFISQVRSIVHHVCGTRELEPADDQNF